MDIRKIRITLFLLSLFLVGCREEELDTEGNDAERTEGDYPNTDQVVNMHGEVENAERIEEFTVNVEQGNPDKVQVISYTVEGDPIYHGLDHNGKAIQFTYDTTMDQFGSGEVTNMSCESIIKKETGSMVSYILQACDQGDDFNVLTFEKRS